MYQDIGDGVWFWGVGSAVADVFDAGCGSGALGENLALQVGDDDPVTDVLRDNNRQPIALVRPVGAPAQAAPKPLRKGAAMCWKCDDPDGAEEEYLNDLREMMRDHHGWQVQFIEHAKRPFAYTVGLHDRGLPELLITGLNAHVSNRVLKSIGHMVVDDGTFLAPAMHIDYQDRFLMEVVEVDHPDVHLKYAVRICGPDVRALQLVWADDRGRWPWDAGWGNGRRRQPVLGIRTPLS